MDEGLMEKYSKNINYEELDNEELLKVIAMGGRNTIYNFLDSSTKMGGDQGFLNSVLKQFDHSPIVTKNRMNQDVFVLQHTARPVEYDVTGFTEKNRDEVSKPIIECILGTKNRFISDFYYGKVLPTDPMDLG